MSILRYDWDAKLWRCCRYTVKKHWFRGYEVRCDGVLIEAHSRLLDALSTALYSAKKEKPV